MPKYSRNAGFKGYEEHLREENEELEIKNSPTKMLVIISLIVIVVVILITVIISAMFNASDETPHKVEVSFTQGEEETLNYESVFGHKEDEESQISQSSEKSNDSSSSKASSNSSSKSSSKSSSSSKSESSSNSSSGNSSYYSESHNTGNNNSSNNYSSSSSYVSQSSQNTQSSKQSSQSSAPKTINVSSVSISNSSISLTVGDYKTISANVTPSNATNKSITWSSTNNAIVTVSRGKITAKSAGTATVVASSNNGKKAYCRVTVKAKVTEPVFDNRYVEPQTRTIYKGDLLIVRLYGDDYCTWEISNPYVVTVTSKNYTSITVRGNKVGITNIIAKTRDGKTFKAKIGVVE